LPRHLGPIAEFLFTRPEATRECFDDEYGSLERGFLTSVFALVVGLERVFHLDQMQDVGFALLTGHPRRCPSRHQVGAWRRHVLWNAVDPACAGKFVGTLRRTFFE